MDFAEGKIWSPVQMEVLTPLCHEIPRTSVTRTSVCTQLQPMLLPHYPWPLRDKPTAKEPQLFSLLAMTRI